MDSSPKCTACCGRPGVRLSGRALLAHTDFETIVLVADDRELCRRICLTHCDLPVLYRFRERADAQMGRRLAGLVRRSPLEHVQRVAHVTIADEFEGVARARVEEIATAVKHSAARGRGDVSVDAVDVWLADLARQQERGQFLFGETAYVVEARRP